MATKISIALIALVVGACGDDGAASGGSTSGATGTTAASDASDTGATPDSDSSTPGGDASTSASDDSGSTTGLSDGTTGGDSTGGNGSTGPGLGDCDGIPVLASGVDGVYIEVEAIDAAARWTEESDAAYAGFSGSYFQWTDTMGGAPGDGETALEYCFAVETEGTYLLEINGRRDHDAGTFCETSENDGCNDVWVQIDGQGSGDQTWTKKMQSGPWEEWRWDGNWDPQNGSPFRTELELSEGPHLLGVAGRSHRVKLDAIRIYLEETEPPGP